MENCIEVLEYVEQKENVIKNVLQDPQWKIHSNEEFLDKSFCVFEHAVEKNRGMAVMTLAEKNAEEVFESFNQKKLWDNQFPNVEENSSSYGKESVIKENYKFNDENGNQITKELSILLYTNRIKKTIFSIGKSLKNNECIDFSLNKMIVYVVNYVFNGRLFAGLIYELHFQNPNDPKNECLLNLLNSLKQMPLYQKMQANSSMKNLNLETIINEKPEKLKKNNFSNSFPFDKGNGERYPSPQDLENFLLYYHNNYHILDCIMNKHEMKLQDANEKDCRIENNEIQGHFAYKKEYYRAKKGGLNFSKPELISEQKKSHD